MVKYDMAWYKEVEQLQRLKNLKKHLHISPLQVSYGLSIVITEMTQVVEIPPYSRQVPLYPTYLNTMNADDLARCFVISSAAMVSI